MKERERKKEYRKTYGKGIKRECKKAKGKSGKVVQVYRKRNVIYVDKVNREKQNGQTVFLPIKPCYCVIEKLLINKDRTKTIEKRAAVKTHKAEKYK